MTPALLALILSSPSPYSFAGMYVEGCSCRKPCPYELVGRNPGCRAVGFFSFDRGSFRGANLSGGKVAYVAGSEGWYRIYFDGPNPTVRAAARDLLSTALKSWGKAESTIWKPITIAGSDGFYVAQIADGAILQFETEPVYGLDGVTPVSYSRIYNRALHPTIMQAKTAMCVYNEGPGRRFSLKSTNAFFNPRYSVKGVL